MCQHNQNVLSTVTQNKYHEINPNVKVKTAQHTEHQHWLGLYYGNKLIGLLQDN